jgi:hypothetical protein
VGGATTTSTGSAAVADAALSATGVTVNTANATATPVATFTDADPAGTVTDYTATINWGDSTTSPGTISGTGPFTVTGSHSYAPNGPFTYTVRTHICDAGGSCADAISTVNVEYMTGRAFGASAKVLALTLQPTPDTGPVATAAATTTSTPCTATIAGLLSAHALCVNVTTSTGPAGSVAKATIADATVGLPLLPTVQVKTIEADSTTLCVGGSSGLAKIALLKVGLTTVVANATPAPNTTLNVAGIKLILNEQVPVPGGLTVNAVHIIVPNVADVVLASATSDIHNCP